jgi:2-polyprenyl-3-methyl-5-hydroxy-6-metoxy-1,4-benzoquinol methylase
MPYSPMNKQQLDACPACGSTSFRHFGEIRDHYYSKEVFPIEECSSCGLRFTQDRPDAESIGAYYDSSNYASHDSKGKASLFLKIYGMARDWMLEHKYKLVRQFKPEWNRVLDYGTGEGFFVEYLQKKGLKAEGIEPSEVARKNFKSRTGSNLFASANDLPADKSYQAISLWHVLEHIHELRPTMEKLCSHLENKGIMVIAVPNQQSKDAKDFGADWAAWDVPRHLYHWDDNSLTKFMSSLGLKKVYTTQLPLDPFYIGLITARYAGKNPVTGIWTGFTSYLHGKQNKAEGSTLLSIWMKDR